MVDLKFPRYIFAIGGAGKNLLYTLLEKEWILREILKPKFAPTIIDVIVIDTAIDEENDDREKKEKIDIIIKRLEEEYRSGLKNDGRIIGRINIIYKLLTKEMTLQSPYDLIGVGENVKAATGAPIWWINDPALGEDWYKKIINKENFKELNFSKGVYRKRAIGKAIYYKAVSEGEFDIDLIQSAQVDIIVGLGGGTGSGMAFDLAKKLKSIQPTADIVLFGILSTLDESPDEKANNYAMISELEYGYLNRDIPFKNVIFVPMEVTRYPGRERSSDEHDRLLKEFDETVPYIIMAYHNNPAQLFFSNLPDYAPFIMATSQLVKYNVASIKKLKDKLMDAFGDKDISLKDEEDVYTVIKKFINEFYGDLDKELKGKLPDDDKAFIKDDRFSKFKMVLEHQFFKELDYNSIKYLKKAVEAGIAGTEPNDIEKQISSIKSEVETISIGEEGYKEDADMRLHKILKKDVETIDQLKNMLGTINKISDNIVRDTLKIIVKADQYSLGRKLNQIRDETDSLTGRQRQIEGQVRNLEDDIKNDENLIAKDIQKGNKEWKDNEIKNLQLMDSIEDIVPLLNNDFTNLKSELEEYANRINSINNIKNIETEPTKSIENSVDKISQDLEKIGLYYDDRGLINKCLINLKELKKAQIESKKKLPITDKLVGAFVKTGRIKKQKEAKNKTTLKLVELNSDRVFEIKAGNGATQISCIYNFDVDFKIVQRKNDIIDGILKRTQDTFPNAAPLIIGMRDTILNPMKRKNIDIDDIIRTNSDYDIDVQKKQNEFKDKNTETTKLSANINMLNSLEKILKSSTPAIKRHAEHLKSYQTNIANIEKDVMTMHGANKENIRYVMELQPTNIYRATLTGANINNILVDQDELSSLKQHLQSGLEREIDNRYNVLVRRVIETADNKDRWQKLKVMNTFVTQANVEPDDIDARRIISNAFSIIKDNYSQWKCIAGDIWEVGMVMLIAAVPFDNIRNIVDARAGYYRYYNDVSESGIAFFHHSYMLEQGKFVKRLRLFNLESEEDKNMLMQSDNDVKNAFLQNYEMKDIRDCLK